MGMDFFEQQDVARRQTGRLVVLLSLAVVATALATHLFVVIVLAFHNLPWHDFKYALAPKDWPRFSAAVASQFSLWQLQPLVWSTLATVAAIGWGWWLKTNEFAEGGDQIALMLGARAVNPQSADPAERRLLNVVAEMALASGVPIPPVYVLEYERGINAFSAGYEPEDAAITISKGCLRYLTREELQGVIAHEFSHILNGDTRLNLRTIGILLGICFIGSIGRGMLFPVLGLDPDFGRDDDRDSDGDDRPRFAPPDPRIVPLGVGLYVIGFVGLLFAGIVRCAICQQREYLADAAAVQFTR
jgi:Zn-dependent protease with chaperone function